MKKRRAHDYPSNVDPRKFAETLEAEGGPGTHGALRKAMVAAGYSEKTAKNGVKMLSAKCISAAVERGIRLGRRLTPEERGDFVRGSLLENAIVGKDRAVKSLELIGKDRAVNLFTPDSQVGLIVLQAPPELNVVAPIKEPPQLGEPVDVVEG